MHNRLTNLLPLARKKQLTRAYLFRFGVVVIFTSIALVTAAGVFLIPTYVLLIGNANAKETRLSSLKSTLTSADEVLLSDRLAALSKDAVSLVSLSKTRSASIVMRTLLSVPRSGISLSGFTYAPVRSSVPNTLVLSGTAKTRDDLRNYQLALQGEPFASSVNLPVSVYAKDTNIDFTITITLAP